jgi:hypothetical protein
MNAGKLKQAIREFQQAALYRNRPVNPSFPIEGRV